MRMVRIVLALLVLLITLTWLVGLAVPRRHVTVRSARLSRSVQEVWSVLSDLPGFARWAPEVSAVSRLPDQNGHPVYALEGKWPMPLEVETLDPPRRMVTRVVDSGLPFGGTWTWEIQPEGSGSRVTLTERGEIKVAPMRTLARFVFGYHSTLDAYLEALGHRLGQDVKAGPAPAGA